LIDDNKKVLSKLIEQHDISKIIWSERYSKNEINQDNITKKYIEKHGVTVETFHSSLLRNPENTLKKRRYPVQSVYAILQTKISRCGV
jgi:deoxyribodipyrimidine photolyase